MIGQSMLTYETFKDPVEEWACLARPPPSLLPFCSLSGQYNFTAGGKNKSLYDFGFVLAAAAAMNADGTDGAGPRAVGRGKKGNQMGKKGSSLRSDQGR